MCCHQIISEKDLNSIMDDLMRQFEAEAWKKTCESPSFDVYASGSLFIELVHFHGVCRIDIYDSQSGWREKKGMHAEHS